MSKQSRTMIAAAFGLAGFVCAFAMVALGDTSDLQAINANNIHLIVVSGPSAALAGLLCAGLFGHFGGWGWLGAGIGAVLATLVGAAIGGTMLAFGLGTMFAPIILTAMLITFPLLGLVWLISMATLHLVVRNMRKSGT